ncbi:hypothetical protein SUGI_0007960 [Cryptomeria japonica]|nr:hypothetical protein SUGI_0007960 [Cryptomeria japonica]
MAAVVTEVGHVLCDVEGRLLSPSPFNQQNRHVQLKHNRRAKMMRKLMTRDANQQICVWKTKWRRQNMSSCNENAEEKAGGESADKVTGAPRTEEAERSDPIGEEMRVHTFVRDELEGRDDDGGVRGTTGDALDSVWRSVKKAVPFSSKDRHSDSE